ncbi:MAG: hypothetical protein JJE41_12000 [Candidatus Heimdallarchaeota archaeon]|nr:hypothetical protein [Candidatus Heimdallarchaeota archaeon]
MITVKIVDRNFRMVDYSSLNQKSQYMKWDRSPVEGDENVVFYTDHSIPQVNPNIKKKVAWLLEPQERKQKLYNWVKKNRDKFDVILTHNKSLLDLKDNFEFIPFGGCWITPKEQKIYKKSKLISIIASGKKETKGHKLRHKVIKDIKKKFPNLLDVYGRGYNEIESKLIGLTDYSFHIVIENSKKDYWFTEKLIDCFATGTVPLYWGCPSIGKFFDEKGIITFHTEKQLYEIVKTLNQNQYEDLLPAIKNNFVEAKKYALAEDWLYINKKNIFE